MTYNTIYERIHNDADKALSNFDADIEFLRELRSLDLNMLGIRDFCDLLHFLSRRVWICCVKGNMNGLDDCSRVMSSVADALEDLYGYVDDDNGIGSTDA